MNYIKRLQTDRAVHAESAKDISADIQSFLELLASDKFNGLDNGERKDWISVSDVLHIILPIRNSVSALAQDLVRE